MLDDTLDYTWLDTPIGRLLLAGRDDVLHLVSFPQGSMAMQPKPSWVERSDAFAEARRQLLAYFAGERTEFDLELHLEGTPFRTRVWRTLATIPFGETRSYGWLAKAVGSPAASRAVGGANGANPIPIILPCHRVIGASGALTGFGGGIETKKFLLEHEAAIAGTRTSQPALL